MSESTFKTTIPQELQQTWDDHNAARNACVAWGEKNGIALHTSRSNISGGKKDDKRKMILACRHHGQPTNNNVHDDNYQDSINPKTFVADDNGKVIDFVDTKASKQRKGYSQRFGCPFRMTLRPLNKGSQQWHVVSFYNGKHNHELAQELSSYPMLRRLDDDDEALVINMIKSHASNASIMSFLASKNKIVKPKDITNLRQTVFNNDPDHTMFQLITKLQENGYEVAFDSKQEGEKRFLVSLIWAHKSAIDLAPKFPEIVILDATYKTNKHRMPFVNVVGTGNIGYPSLKTFCIAGGWVSRETNETYAWVIEKLRDVVWPSDQPVSPQTFVTDSADPLTKALDKFFLVQKNYYAKFISVVIFERSYKSFLISRRIMKSLKKLSIF